MTTKKAIETLRGWADLYLDIQSSYLNFDVRQATDHLEDEIKRLRNLTRCTCTSTLPENRRFSNGTHNREPSANRKINRRKGKK